MKKILFGAAFAALSLGMAGGAVAQRNNVDILIVDTARIFTDCTACRAAQAQLQTQVNALQTRRTTLGQQLQTEGAPIQAAVNALNGKQPDAALSARITAFETKQNNAAQEIQRTSQTIQSTEANVNQQIGTRLGPIIETVRNTRKAAVVLAKNQTLANDNALDVTNDVLTQLNQQLPSVSVTPLPQAQQPAPAPRPQGR
jgi:Skp family chaperone for outer membrane proteins